MKQPLLVPLFKYTTANNYVTKLLHPAIQSISISYTPAYMLQSKSVESSHKLYNLISRPRLSQLFNVSCRDVEKLGGPGDGTTINGAVKGLRVKTLSLMHDMHKCTIIIQ